MKFKYIYALLNMNDFIKKTIYFYYIASFIFPSTTCFSLKFEGGGDLIGNF